MGKAKTCHVGCKSCTGASVEARRGKLKSDFSIHDLNPSMSVDNALSGAHRVVLAGLEWKLEIMAETVLQDLPSESRKKFE
jgi:hypothetical protein